MTLHFTSTDSLLRPRQWKNLITGAFILADHCAFMASNNHMQQTIVNRFEEESTLFGLDNSLEKILVLGQTRTEFAPTKYHL